jgi:hypothetical protein
VSQDAINIWIVATIMLLTWIARLKWTNRELQAKLASPTPAMATPVALPQNDGEALRLHERVAVLERIAVEKENTLSREIDSLRER